MARKYARDNRGRFASKGAGATARGGRLKTAGGNKRETQKRRIFSADSKKLGPAAVDAASRSGKVNLSRKYGGQGQGYKSRLGLSAARAAKTAQNAARASKRSAGLPSSGGAMRFGNGVGPSRLRAKAALTREKVARAAYFKTDYGTKAQTSAKAKLDAASKKADAKRNQWREAKMARMDAPARKPMRAMRAKAAAPANTVANKTGQAKTLNRFNSRPERTRGAYVGGRYVDKAKLTGRQPLDMGRGDDRAFGRVATKSARSRAAAKPAVKPASNRSGQASRGLARASKIAMETRRVQATGGAFKSPAAKAKIDRTNKIAADAQAFYSTGKRAKQAPSAATIAQVGRPGKRKAVGSISEAKAGRIVARLDANRPSQRRISGSLRKTQNAIRTHQRATAFALAPSGRARSRGNSISVNDSIRRAVANAAKKRRRAS